MNDSFDILAPSICDCHVHVGAFEGNYYFSPKMVGSTLNELGIKKCVVSSTSTIYNDFSVVVKEINELISISKGKVFPLLWVTPSMVNFSDNLSYYLNKFCFQGFKIHPYTNNWKTYNAALRKVFKVAKEHNFPILLHTGWTSESNALNFKFIIEDFPSVKVVLAHGRPTEQAIEIISELNNAYVDTAFMATGDIRLFVEKSLNNKIIFGTDFPIDKFYYSRISLKARYKRRINHLVKCFGYELVMKWTNENFEKVFSDEIDD